MRRSAHIRLEAATGSLDRLAQAALRSSRVVVVARLRGLNDELPQLISQCAGMPLVVLVPDAAAVALRALRAGAGAVLDVGAGAGQLAAAVSSVFHGLLVLPAGDTRFADRSSALALPPEPLTPREREILSLLAAGDSNKTIAARLSISVHTVKFHISSILAKLGVTSRTEAVALGLRLGIVLL